MTLTALRSLALAGLLAAPVVLWAQEESSREEERLAALARSADWYKPSTDLSMGFRFMTSGANVRFGSLGTVPASALPADVSDGLVQRNYNNGTVKVDGPRPNEVDSNGNQISTPGGRFQTTSVDSNGVVTVVADYLSYTPGLTRSWTYSTPDQALARPGYIAMNAYSASSDGGSFDKKQGSSVGVELQLAHSLYKLSKRINLGLSAGLAINAINNKVTGDVQSTLNTYTDYYSLHGQTAPVTSSTAIYSGPTYANITLPNGTVLTNAMETTVPISALPDASSLTNVFNGTSVHGTWEIKGAYMMVRVGPSLRAQLTKSLSLSATIGLAGAYSGTTYTATESFLVPVVGTSIAPGTIASTENKLLSGYYADVNMEFAANERTELYGGVSLQKLSSYDQTLDGRTAHIDIGTSTGLRGGLNIRF